MAMIIGTIACLPPLARTWGIGVCRPLDFQPLAEVVNSPPSGVKTVLSYLFKDVGCAFYVLPILVVTSRKSISPSFHSCLDVSSVGTNGILPPCTLGVPVSSLLQTCEKIGHPNWMGLPLTMVDQLLEGHEVRTYCKVSINMLFFSSEANVAGNWLGYPTFSTASNDNSQLLPHALD